jgi:prepilin-type N-terminal cleavage/methylation domain-containing protein/prepilin-type processing-associated H-X9-DG protein
MELRKSIVSVICHEIGTSAMRENVAASAPRRAFSRGFTLVELLVVIAIIGILVALLLPAIQAAREAARRSQCSNNLKNIGLALLNHADTRKRLPAATQFRPGKPFPEPVNGPGGTWVVQILPYIEEQALYDRFDHKQPSNHANNARVVGVPLTWLICPSDSEIPPNGLFPTDEKQDGATTNPNPGSGAMLVMGLWYPVSAGPTSFDGCPFCPNRNTGLNWCCQGASLGSRSITVANDPLGPAGTRAPTFAGMFGRYEIGIKLTEVTDGLTHTIMAGETIAAHCKYQCAHCPNFPVAPTNTPLNTFLRTPKNLGAGTCGLSSGALGNPEEGGYCEACGYKSRHPSGAHLLMGDGSVHFVNEAIDFEVYYLLGARKSGATKHLP